MLRKNKKCFPNRGTTWDKPQAIPTFGLPLAPTICWSNPLKAKLATRQQTNFFSRQCQILKSKNNE